MNAIEMEYKSLKKIRELTQEELLEFKLLDYKDQKMDPQLECFETVWSAGITEKSITYRIYDGGTNRLVILKYTPILNTWENVNLEDLSHDVVYTIIWKMANKIWRLNNKINQ